MTVIAITVYVIWFLSEIVLDRLMRVHHLKKHKVNLKPLILIWTAALLTIGFAVYFAYTFYFPISANPAIEYWGLAVIGLGIVLRLLIVYSMGRLFATGDPSKQEPGLIKDGFFKYLRHPAFAASLISFIGFGLSLNNYVSFMIILISVLYVFMKRIEVEELFLLREYGEEYAEYRKHTKGLIPFLY